jgi:DeoR/GlpR family transcriptional regulator of sugar metabolism
MTMIGDWALEVYNSTQADIVFLGTDGFSGREGPCSASFEEMEIKKSIIRQSKKRYLLADFSKF